MTLGLSIDHVRQDDWFRKALVELDARRVTLRTWIGRGSTYRSRRIIKSTAARSKEPGDEREQITSDSVPPYMKKRYYTELLVDGGMVVDGWRWRLDKEE